MKSAARSATIMTGAFVLPEGIFGIIEASTTRRLVTPFTLRNEEEIGLYCLSLNFEKKERCGMAYLRRGSTTVEGSLGSPILQVPTG